LVLGICIRALSKWQQIWELESIFIIRVLYQEKKIDEIFKMSDVYVLPSVSEPFGLTVLEALKAGVPVIVSKQSGISELIQNAIKVDFWNVDDIANHIINLLKDEDYKNQIKQKLNEEQIHRITWYDSARKIEEIYDQVLNKIRK